MNDSSRPPGMDGRAQVITVGALTAIAVSALGVLQFGHWFGSDGQFLVGPGQAIDIDHAVRTPHEWLPLNPILWPKAGLKWTALHTRLTIVFGAAILYGYHQALQWRSRKIAAEEHPDAIAKHMGRGKSMTLAAVTAKNKEAGYTASDIVGLVICKSVQTGELLYAGWRSTITAIMGPGSGKTTALAIPFTLEAPGWVYGTTNKRDYPDAVREARSERGQMLVFDPQRIADEAPTWYWDPLSYIKGPDADTKARIQANVYADAAADPEAKVDGFFGPRGRSLMAGLLLAAAVAGEPITKVVEWVNEPNKDTPVGILEDAGWTLSASDLKGIYDLVIETKRGIFANAAAIVEFLFNRSALPWVCKTDPTDMRLEFVPEKFVRSYSHTLISLSKEGIGSLGPLVAALTIAVTEAAQEYAKTCSGGRMPVPGCILLDEAANVARIRSLPDWYSYFASLGLFILTILQSEAQGRSAWGENGMDKMLGASTHRIYGRGIDDEKLLRRLSLLIGPHKVKQYTGGNSSPSGLLGKGNASKNVGWSWHTEPIMEPAAIHALPEWRALVSVAGDRPVYTRLIPFWERSPDMKAAVAESIELHGPRENMTV